MTLEEIAIRLSLTRERVRQIELGALKKLWARLNDEPARQDEQPAATAVLRRTSRAAA
jgi:DNA-directed RNA polymerase sigma subunit (sigma70/sigma32)